MTRMSDSAAQRLGVFSKDKTELLRLLLDKESGQTQKIKPYPRGNSTGAVRLPTSWAQQRLWFIDQLEGGSAGYISTVAVRLQGVLDQEALQKALDTLVQRHETLRTVFVNAEGNPSQEISAEGRFSLKVIDLSGYEEAEREAQVRLQEIEETHGKFDLRVGPLIRGRLLRVQAEEHVLLITMHHIVSDGWSAGVLIREFAELYRAYREGRDDPLEPLPIQYADYAQWQRQWLQGEVLDKQLSYWRACLEGASSQLELPTDRPRPAVQSYRGENVEVVLDAQLSAKLRAFAQRHEMTLFMVLYAGWAVLLSRLSGQDDVVIGTAIANRQRPELEGLIGFFVNTLALRVGLQIDMQVDELLEQVKAVTLGAYDHQDVPFERVVEELQPQRSLSRNPLFQVAFALQNAPSSDLQLPGLTATLEGGVDEPAIFDLFLSLEERGDEIVGSVNYAADLFDRETMKRWMACFTVLLRGMTDEASSRIGDLPILPDRERHQIIELFNATQAAYPQEKLIQALFEEQVERTPDAIAVMYEGESLTYAELNGKANQLARYLSEQGAQIGEYIPILMPRCLQLLIAQLAVLKSGGVYVPVDPKLPLERQAFIIRDCSARRVLAEQGVYERLEQKSLQCIDCTEAAGAISDLPRDNLALQLDTPPPAYVMYTSGSTGVPKGVIVPHRAVNRLVINNGYAQIEPTDCIAHCSNPAFDASTFEIWGALLNGARILIVPQSVVLEAERFADVIRQQRVTVLWLTVGLFTQYTEALADVFGQLRYLLVGGDVVEPSTVGQVMRHSPPRHLLNGYGPTECTTFSATYLIESVDEDTKSIPIGRPISNTRIYILDNHLQPVPIGVTGEIYIGGAGVALGYLNRPELTAERFITDPFSTDPEARLYKSGDLGRWRADGNIDFLGRNDQQVKIRGYRIELEEIEAQLLQHTQVKEAVVLAREDEPGEKRLVAYVVADLPQLKVLQKEGSDEASAELVMQWETLYEETYSVAAPGPSFVGWNSSYTGEPIPEPQMQEWLAYTLERVKALRPKKVLEIGCGVGLVLQHLAPQCEVYVGTDISTSALDQLRQWMNGREDLKHVELLRRSATELQDLESGSFDTLVLNSVVQYFPDINYLLTVLQEAVRLLGPGGKIFIGDVRHLGLLPMFHSAVQLSKAGATVSVGQLRKRIARAIAQDKELVIDPQFFEMLPGRLPGISAVEVQLKRGRESNELTRYRYDVVLHAGEQIAARAVCEPLEWQTDIGSVAELEATLAARRWCAVCLSSIPSSRLAREAAAQRLIETSDERLEVGVLRRQLNELPLEEVDPDRFWQWGEAHGYDVQVRARGSQECCEVQLLDRAQADRIPHAIAPPIASVKPWSAYANDPLEHSVRQQLIPQLREYLKGRLPEYMIPSAWMALKQLPLTPNGKVDKRALPVPQSRPEEMGEYVAPRTELERTLVNIWAEVLRVDQVGVNDNFFELGGHSLLIVQMMERLRRVGLSAEVRSIYGSPTVADLARTLAGETVEQFVVPPNLIPSGCEVITPQMLPLVELETEQIERIVQSVPGGAGNIQDIYPLAPLQEGILFHHLLSEHGGDAYARPMLLSLSSRGKLEDFIAALQEVIDRHDILRTAVLWEQLPRPVQVVYRQAILPVEEIALDPDRDPIEQLRERMRPERQWLDLREAPLMRLQVAADTQGIQWYALLQTHHIVFDAESLHTMLAEVMAYVSGSAQELPEPVPYRNYVAQALTHARTHDAESFFRSKLAEIDEPTAPFGLLDVHGDGSRNEEARQALEPALAQRVRVQARHLSVSAATLFHAAWGLVVARTSGRDEVVFGSVLLGRLQGSAGAQRILGMFINTLPLRLRVQDVSAEELVEQTQRELVELLNHEQASLAEAQRCSGITGSMPLFSALLNYVHSSGDLESEFAGAAGVTLLASQGATNYPIVLTAYDHGEGFVLEMETDRRIDPHRMLGYLSTAMCSLVDALEWAPQTSALSLSILPERERHQVIELFNATQAAYPQEKQIQALFEEQVERTPGAIAVVYEGESLTYADLNGKANQLARYLSEQGVQIGECIPILMPRCLQMLIAQLAVLKSGGVYVPVDPKLPLERQAFMIRDCGANRILADSERCSDFGAERLQWIDYAGVAVLVGSRSASNLNLRMEALLPAYVMYTSGSTGVPKGVIVPHRAVNRLVINNGYAQIEPADCIAYCSNPAFDASTFEIWGALLNGARILIVPQSVVLEAERFADVISEHGVTVLFETTALFNQHAIALPGSFARLRYLLFGGEVSDPNVVRKMMREGPPRHLLNLYGPTETTTFATSYPTVSVTEDARSLPVGRPISNTQVYILDSHLQPVPIGVAGEIYIGGAGVALGYLNRPELTAERFVADPFSTAPQARLYKSGDLGKWSADGNIDFLGRNDQQVKLRGYRIELGEIETKLLQHSQVKEAVVLAREDVPGEKRLVAYVIPKDLSDVERAPSVEVLREHLTATLPEYMVPSAFVILESLPLTSNGKLDRRALPAPELGAYVSRQYEAPQGEVEEILAGIWRELLHLGRVGRQDNFFELGGHSLIATRVITHISHVLDVDLPLRVMFEKPTIQELSGCVVREIAAELSMEAL